jgi:pimeloyl-ACP methyl ester carboxylesterase/DNA-binding winged helix-turn-helix (wHTH) protein
MRYRFGNHELSTETRELLTGSVARSVEPQVFDLIQLLVESAGRLVTHDELIGKIWAGRIVSDSAISARISAARAALGDDGTRQELIKTVPKRGFRFVGAVETDGDGPSPSPAQRPTAPHARQRVMFCNSRDGTRIALAISGSGMPLVKAGHWLTHLEHDWQSPIWRPFLDALGGRFQLVRYDQRGNGLSDRTVPSFSLDAFVDDLKAVVDAVGLDRFALYGTSQGAPIAIAYACRHPQRVSALVLQGGYHKGRLVRVTASEREQGEAMLTLVRHGWGKPQSPFMKAFSSIFMPEGTREQIDSLASLQSMTTTSENAAMLRRALDEFEVTSLLGGVSAPTLVLHARDDGVQPLDQGRELAAGIPGAEFVMLDTSNHIIVPGDRAWDELIGTVTDFVGAHPPVRPAP